MYDQLISTSHIFPGPSSQDSVCARARFKPTQGRKGKAVPFRRMDGKDRKGSVVYRDLYRSSREQSTVLTCQPVFGFKLQGQFVWPCSSKLNGFFFLADSVKLCHAAYHSIATYPVCLIQVAAYRGNNDNAKVLYHRVVCILGPPWAFLKPGCTGWTGAIRSEQQTLSRAGAYTICHL